MVFLAEFKSDRGREKVFVADYMLDKRGTNRGSKITEKSTHSQRIESVCGEMYTQVFFTSSFISWKMEEY